MDGGRFRQSRVADSGGPHEGARAASCPALDQSHSLPSRTAAAHWSASVRLHQRPQSYGAVSENAITGAIAAWALPGQDMTGLDFPAWARPFSNEEGWNHDAIEWAAWGRRTRRRTCVAANYPEHLPERRRMIPAVGGLFKETQEWIERRGARQGSGGLRAEFCLTLCEGTAAGNCALHGPCCARQRDFLCIVRNVIRHRGHWTRAFVAGVSMPEMRNRNPAFLIAAGTRILTANQ